MSNYEPDEPDYSEYCEAVRIGREGKNDVEVVIFYTPLRGLAVLRFPRFNYQLRSWYDKFIASCSRFRISHS